MGPIARRRARGPGARRMPRVAGAFNGPAETKFLGQRIHLVRRHPRA
jgi:hypothetical protein